MLSFYSNEGITWQYTTAMAPWRGGFYERLVDLVKQGLRKEIGRKLLSWDKLVTMITEGEAVINTHPLNLDTVIPFNIDKRGTQHKS